MGFDGAYRILDNTEGTNMKHTLALLLAASLVVGCSYEERLESSGESEVETVAGTVEYDAAKFVGKWVGRTEMSDEGVAKMRETMSEDELQEWLVTMKEMAPTLELLEDGTYSMSNPLLEFPTKDTWTLAGDKLTLASSGYRTSGSWNGTFADMTEDDIVPNKEPMDLSVESDGTELVMADETAVMNFRIVFTKE